MSRRPASLLVRDVPRSRALGVLVAVGAVAVTTLVIYPLRHVAPPVSTGIVYLLAVLLVSTYWGWRFGLLTAVASTAAFNVFHIPPTGRFAIADAQNWVALGVFFAAAGIASALAELARSRAADAERRRQEADLAAEMARTLLGGAELRQTLPVASAKLAHALNLRHASIELGDVQPAVQDVAVALDLGERGATIRVPADADPQAIVGLRERVAPALAALLAAALERDRLQAEVVETAALRRSDVIKTALLRAVSHDLRSPLTSIIAAGDALRSPTMPAGERDELGGLVVNEAARLSRLVEKLLDLSRLQAGAAEPRRDWCSIEEVVGSAVEHLEARDGETGVQIALDRGLPLMRADAAQLERVFVNLLENARRYCGGHPVKVRARVVGGVLNVRVIDRGPGIAQRDLPFVFEPFRQDAGGAEHGGAGLGLAIVKGFVEANGGRVRVESQPHQGTVVALEFPLAAEDTVGATAR
ncbi:MAG TPA: ATP-binding protein [Solirubrobacteraceae bacterium]|nr:ATP-binding protein [Solirubrobacteraceae bacterium]